MPEAIQSHKHTENIPDNEGFLKVMKSLSKDALTMDYILHFHKTARFFINLKIDAERWRAKMKVETPEQPEGKDIFKRYRKLYEKNPESNNPQFIRRYLEKFIRFDRLVYEWENKYSFTHHYKLLIEFIEEVNDHDVPILLTDIVNENEYKTLLNLESTGLLVSTLKKYLGLHFVRNGYKGVVFAIENIIKSFKINEWEKSNANLPELISVVRNFIKTSSQQERSIKEYLRNHIPYKIDYLYEFIDKIATDGQDLSIEVIQKYIITLIQGGDIERILSLIRIFFHRKKDYYSDIWNLVDSLRKAAEISEECKQTVALLLPEILTMLADHKDGSIILSFIKSLSIANLALLIELHKLIIFTECDKLIQDINHLQDILVKNDLSDGFLPIFSIIVEIHKAKSLQIVINDAEKTEPSIQRNYAKYFFEVLATHDFEDFDIQNLMDETIEVTIKYWNSSVDLYMDDFRRKILQRLALKSIIRKDYKRFVEIMSLEECSKDTKIDILEAIMRLELNFD